jgi:hypothetical protein
MLVKVAAPSDSRLCQYGRAIASAFAWHFEEGTNRRALALACCAWVLRRSIRAN